ncbi:MAG: hypothetical protein HKN19_03090 [Halioglobus sp.]|nr:hypothetical protein [Halioglobus sp.]
MENLIAIVLALAPPVLFGALCFNLLVPREVAGRGALVWGHGALLGLLAATLLLRAVDMLGYGLDFNITIGALLVLLLVLAGLNLRRRTWLSSAPATTWTIGTRLLFGLLLAFVLLRLVSLGLEILWRPLFPWDATMHWATKAKVWFAEGSMVPFVQYNEWAELFGEGVFTDRHPEYPATIPLLQVWMNLALGAWNESLMNLPWLVCYAALGLLFYGHLRFAGLAAVTAMAFTYLLLSMPLLNIHVALAGYADLFLGATYGAALMFFFHWCQDRAPWKLVAMVIFLLLCPALKNEGTIWAASLAPAFAAMLLPRTETLKFFVLLALLVILAILVIPNNMVIAGTTLADLLPRFNPEGLKGLLQSVWLHDNWHLQGYVLLGAVPAVVLLRERVTQHHLGFLLALAAAAGAFLYLFLFTGFSGGAKDLSGVGRLWLHLCPGLMFMAAVFYRDLVAKDTVQDRAAKI